MLSADALEQHRTALRGHCYRMLGSAADADDAVQETLVRAWRHAETFEERASLRTWLYRIATNVCLDAIGDRERRARPMELRPVCTIDDELTSLPGERWIEPIPDAHAVPADVDPAQRAVLRESIRLAFVAALQHLPARQRAALVLADVLGWSAAEIAEALATTTASVNSALQRARATLVEREVSLHATEPTAADREVVERYVAAFERYDIDALAALLRDDVTMSMPPYALWLRGAPSVKGWMLGRGSGCRGSRVVPAAACGLPAFGHYRLHDDGMHRAFGLLVLEVAGGQITGINTFLDVESVFPRFGLPLAMNFGGEGSL